jgi:hypothetical protein
LAACATILERKRRSLVNSASRIKPVLWTQGVLLFVLILSVGLVSCQVVEEKVEKGVDKVEEQVVTEAKKLALSQISEGLDKLKDTIQSDEGKGADWASSEIAKIRETLNPVLEKVQQGGFSGLDWVDEELSKLEQKLADPENVDALSTTIDEFIRDLENRLGLSE